MCGSWVIILMCGIAAPEILFGDLRSIYLNSFFYSLRQDSTLNAFHGQALATALKLNNTVVDLKLANNYCGNEGAEACEHICDELTAGGLGPAGLWLTLTVSHFLKHWVDGCCFCFFWRQWRPVSAPMQRSSVWTWITVESVMLGWRPGGCFAAVGPVFDWSCRDVTRLLGNAVDYVWRWRCWGIFCMNLYDRYQAL